MKVGISDKRVDMGSMGDFTGVMGKNPGSRHQLHKESAMDRSPYYDKVHNKVCRSLLCFRLKESDLGIHFISTMYAYNGYKEGQFGIE